MNVCAGTQLLQLHTPYCCLQLTSMGLFPSTWRGQPLGKMKIKKSCSHKRKLLEGEQLGWHCKAQPSWVTMCDTALKLTFIATNLTWELMISQYSGDQHFNQKSEGSWQKYFTHKNFWTEYLKLPWFWIYNL